MNYPMKDGEISIKEPLVEFHIVTPRGAIACIFENLVLARQRMTTYPDDFRLIKVERTLTDLTPSRATKRFLAERPDVKLHVVA
jgi:hypothetical protein